ncbi:MAG: single-stranded DNA-binding protein [Candidatus Omnitrophica bacterium]|nr:single-stranded DNA-binding protein [Candidatus Omnitrophota bacterium]
MSLNSVNIMGNLTRDPELKTIPSGKSVCSMSIANNRIYTKNGERVTEVSYFDIEVWGAVAENCAKYLKKGSGIIVEGRLKQERWEKDGKTQSRVRIAANSIHFMPRKSDDSGSRMRSDAGSSEVPIVDGTGPEDIAWEE